MDLDSRQTRRMFLVGTVAFPTPFPSVGTISFETGNMSYPTNESPMAKELVVVQEFSQHSRSMVRALLQQHVAAIFIPGFRDGQGEFRISREASVDDFEQGMWFVDFDVTAATIRARLNRSEQDDFTTRSSILRGIVFVAKNAPVLSIAEMTETAAATCDIDWPSSFGPSRASIYSEGIVEAPCLPTR